ncbi:MAG: HAMP domain-containing sensor histidine kinase [Isosphaeraceae bacterium]
MARVRHLANYRQMAATAVLNEQLAQIGRLLAGIVHEIRGPLGVIRNHAEVLELKSATDPSLKSLTSPILSGCQLLQVRLEHLMAAVRGGPAQSRGIDPSALVREVASIFQKGLDPRRAPVKVAIDLPDGIPVIQGDPGRLMQVLLNLLANAYDAILAHSASGGTITVRASIDVDGLEIDVADDGPGIAAAHIGRVFEPFFTTKTGGSGYGLYLAAQMIREHGGNLRVRNREEGGACFTIRLPRTPDDAAGAMPPFSTQEHDR